MSESLRERAERYIDTECISRTEWSALVTELLAEVARLKVEVREADQEVRDTAQGAADEARWKHAQGDEYGSY